MLINLNGRNCEVSADPTASLLSVLRDTLHLTGAKPGCGEGQCGACTVLVEGSAVHSCITPLSDVASKKIQTIEGLAAEAKFNRVQQSFLECAAFQCGYCTPGMIMATVALLMRNPNPTVEEIRMGLDGNLCRC
jgi:aerobic-type carbon monoxide dehydrogenase small subunit (CoxS/CutS family)